MSNVISLSGYARSGKDTLAGFIVKTLGYKRVAFADALKQTLYDTNPLLDPDGTRLQDAIDTLGQEGIKVSKYNDEYRRLCQNFGTEGARNNISETVWIDIVLDKIGRNIRDGVVITDTRFANELDAMRSVGGLTVWVDRPDVRPINGHVSENQIKPEDCDLVIVNDGSPIDLFYKLATNMDLENLTN